MRIFAYALRPYDELPCLEALSRELGFEYGWTADYPTQENAVLMALPNVIVTPHMAFYTAESVEGMVRSNVEALLAFAAGAETPYEVR